MLPTRGALQIRHRPIIVWLLIGANVLVFLYQSVLPPRAFEQFLLSFALIPSRYFGELSLYYPAQTPGDFLPFATNMFLHGGVLHLVFNMWSLWVFGPAVEDRVGPHRFLGFYIACGVAASLAHALFNPASVLPALGASGAIAGVIGCYARMFPFTRLTLFVPILFIPFFFQVPALGFAVIWFVLQAIPGILSLGAPSDMGGVAWWAHIGGFIAGWLLAPRMKRREYRKETYSSVPEFRRDRPDKPWRAPRGPWG